MTRQEYDNACRAALSYGKAVRVALWAIPAVSACLLASSAALTWGTPASILASLALVVFFLGFTATGQINAAKHRQIYARYREADPSYTFTNQLILATSRYVQSSIAWAAVGRVIETRALFVLELRNSYICIPKRDIPTDRLGDFMQLLKAHRANFNLSGGRGRI
jgi:hypothetical protein